MPRHYRLLAALACGLLIWMIPAPDGVSAQGWRLLAVFVATVAGMMTQALETGAVVWLGLAAAILTGAMTPAEVLDGFSNSIVWLIVSAFLFSHAVAATGMGKRVAWHFIRAFGGRTLGLGYALAAAELIIAPAVPANTARAGGILFPIVSSLAQVCGGRRLGGFLMLNQFHATIILSAMFLTAMSGNPLAVELAAKTTGARISWGLWAVAALVPGLVSLAATPWILYRLHPPEERESPRAAAEAVRQMELLGPLSGPERRLAAVLVCCLLLWSSSALHRLDATTVAWLGLSALLLSGVIAWREVLGVTGAWDALIWFGGLIGMAEAMARLGVSAWLAGALGARLHGPGLWILVILSVIYFYAHYGFASLNAQISALYAPFLAAAVAAGAPPLLSSLLLGFFSSLNGALTHYSTGPAPIYFGAGYVDQAAWWKLGAVVSLLHLAVWIGLGLPYWKLIGVW